MGWREGKRRVRVTCVCVCVCMCDLSKTIPARQHRSSSAAALGNCFALLWLSPSLSLALPAFPLLLLQWATLFSSPHTRHKSMFDFHNNNNSKSRREIRKAMRKKHKTRGTRGKETARRNWQGHGTRDTGDRTQDIMFAPCLKFLPLVWVIFILYTFFLRFPALLFISCVTHFVVVSLRQMKCIKFCGMRGATRRESRAKQRGRNSTLRVCGQHGR